MNISRVILLGAALALASPACGDDAVAPAERARSEEGATTTSTVRAANAAASKNNATIEMSGAITFSFDGAGGKCSTVRKENFSEDAGDLAVDMTGYEFDDPDGSFDVTFLDEENDGSIETIILNGRGENAHWSLAKGSGTAQGRTDLKGVTFDVELGSVFNAHPPLQLKGSISCA